VAEIVDEANGKNILELIKHVAWRFSRNMLKVFHGSLISHFEIWLLK